MDEGQKRQGQDTQDTPLNIYLQFCNEPSCEPCEGLYKLSTRSKCQSKNKGIVSLANTGWKSMRCLAAAAWRGRGVPGEVQPQHQHQRHGGRGHQPHPGQPPRRHRPHQLPHASAGQPSRGGEQPSPVFSSRTWSLASLFTAEAEMTLPVTVVLPFAGKLHSISLSHIFLCAYFTFAKSVCNVARVGCSGLAGVTRHLENS